MMIALLSTTRVVPLISSACQNIFSFSKRNFFSLSHFMPNYRGESFSSNQRSKKYSLMRKNRFISNQFSKRYFSTASSKPAISPKIIIENLNFAFDSRPIFDALTLKLFSGDKVVLVGENGIGKSTLLKLILGKIQEDEEKILVKGSIGYLPQTFEEYSETSVVEFFIQNSKSDPLKQLLERRGEEDLAQWYREFNAYKGYQFFKSLNELGVEKLDLEKKIAHLSGGEKTKVFLAALAFSHPDILLLDEPTNHLDENGILWLESFLQKHIGIILMTTHDRLLINRTANRIAEISRDTRRLVFFRGGYSYYLKEQEKNRIRLMQENAMQKKELRTLISKLRHTRSHQHQYKARSDSNKKSFNARGERKQKSTSHVTLQLKRKIDLIENNLVNVPKKASELSIDLEKAHSERGSFVYLENLSKQINGVTLFSGVSLTVKQKERIVIHGKNGQGKTTLLKIIAGMIPPDIGNVVCSSKDRIGFLDQEQETLNLSLTPIELLMMDEKIELSESSLIVELGQFGIYRKEDLFTPLQFLSIGSRRKAQLAQIILRGCDILLLDEPTNHIDLPSLEHIEEKLIEFPGPVIAVSHDRYFTKKIATQELFLEIFR